MLGVGAKVAKGLETPAHAFLYALIATPGVLRGVWPHGDASSVTIQIGYLNQDLDVIKNETAKALTRGLDQLMDDPRQFVSFTANGTYSGKNGFSIPTEGNILAFALKTYITSVSMKENGWYAEWNPTKLVLNRSNCDAVDGSGGSIYKCPYFTMWISSETGLQLSLYKKKDGDKKSLDTMKKITGNGFADLGVLLEGAYNCTAQGMTPVTT